MTLVAPDLTILGSRYGAGFEVCGSIDFPRDGWARDLAVGRYFLVLESSYAGVDLALALSILNPACSNGAVERRAGETCDDGNLLSGDGCDASCQLEGAAFEEREPNNALAQSMPAEAAIGKRLEVVGRISPAGDVDYFSFEIPPGRTATLMARTYGQRGDYLSCAGDTVLTLLDAAGVTLAENDDIFGVGCSTIDGAGLIDTGAANLGPGQYHLRVREYFGTRPIPAYVLQIELK
ncbi:MAG: hypothetical protein IT384_34535 [Deltaproteobacteria bacterium]|nr:hypothetical protein [Deltaproteobacteria bacterium]